MRIRSSVQKSAEKLAKWFVENQRILPWRQNKDPYKIWISEVMLQQTTVTAVQPYYHKFLLRFPTLQALASASQEDVLEQWSGLGYYSRARNLHKSAQLLNQKKQFPQSYKELLELPGFGPYTSRAVSSLAFAEPVGVVDGNVIRVLSRKYDLNIPWWTTQGRVVFQEKADALAQVENPYHLNQGLMELGATICTPQNPLCWMCPWQKECSARKNETISERPLMKPRKSSEIWIWKPEVIYRTEARQKLVALAENNYAPFLKGQWLFPGVARKSPQKPTQFDLKHGITHHDIYIQVKKITAKDKSTKLSGNMQWVNIKNISKINPTSLVKKVISFSEEKYD